MRYICFIQQLYFFRQCFTRVFNTERTVRSRRVARLATALLLHDGKALFVREQLVHLVNKHHDFFRAARFGNGKARALPGRPGSSGVRTRVVVGLPIQIQNPCVQCRFSTVVSARLRTSGTDTSIVEASSLVAQPAM